MTEPRKPRHGTRNADYAARQTPGIPELFLERMAHLLGDEYAAFRASYAAGPSAGLRVNTLKIAPEAFQQIAPFDLAPVPWCAVGFTIGESDIAAGKHPYHAAGLYYLQDPSAMAVTELLDPQPGERVLDLAAAPGGKATHIAAKMQGQGLLVANEIHAKRAWELAGNLERWGAANVAVLNETPERLAERFADFFDRVLVDAPCSGEGMLRKGEAARIEWAPELVRGCALRQTAILEQSARLVRPGGRLVYSTCTFNPEENEGTIARFLDTHREFELIAPPRLPGFARGRPEWLAEQVAHSCGNADRAISVDQPSSASYSASGREATYTESVGDLARAVRLWPHTAPGEGHFIAVMRRHGDATSPMPKPWRPARLPRPVETAYRHFWAANMTAEPISDRLALIGSYLYVLPAALPDLAGLRFLHPGWWLGTIKKDRFEPSHALALGLSPNAAHCAARLADDTRIIAFLRGQPFTDPGEDSWALVCVDSHPLGWGKRVAGVIKSHYPRGLRWV